MLGLLPNGALDETPEFKEISYINKRINKLIALRVIALINYPNAKKIINKYDTEINKLKYKLK